MSKKTNVPTEEKTTDEPVDKTPPAPDDEVEIIEIEGMENEFVDTVSSAPGIDAPKTGEEVESGDLRAQLESLQREKKETHERLLRKQADLENARKRVEKEKREFLRFSGGELIRKLLPVVDNLERACAVAEEVEETNLQQGLRLVQQEFLDILKREGLTGIEAEGERFDPNRHEAVLREETDEVEPDLVIGVLQKGYFYRERLLRPAMVKVSVLPSLVARVGIFLIDPYVHTPNRPRLVSIGLIKSSRAVLKPIALASMSHGSQRQLYWGKMPKRIRWAPPL